MAGDTHEYSLPELRSANLPAIKPESAWIVNEGSVIPVAGKRLGSGVL
jgi:hypothetical protein